MDAGDANIEDAPATDQRGSARIDRGAIDIGAVEYGNLPPEVILTAEDVTMTVGDEVSVDASDLFTDPEGDAMYGLDVLIHPDYRGYRLGRRLYEARKELCRSLNLRAILAGGQTTS